MEKTPMDSGLPRHAHIWDSIRTWFFRGDWLPLALLVLIPGGSLWIGLSRYMTVDESLWLGRFNWYALELVKQALSLLNLGDFPGEPKMLYDSGMANRLLVGLPGTALCRLLGLDGFDRLIVFRSVQVAEWGLFLGGYFLLSARRLRIPAIYALGMILAIPLIRGMARVINYDTFVSLFTLLSLAEYYVFRRLGGGRRHRQLALLFCALAVISKPSGLFALVFLAGMEIHRCATEAGNFSAYAALMLRQGASFGGWLLAFFTALLPSAWLDTGSLKPFFYDIYVLLPAAGPAALAAAFAGAVAWVVGTWAVVKRTPRFGVPRLWITALAWSIPMLFLAAALLVQRDHVMSFVAFDEDRLVDYLSSHGLSYSKNVAFAFTYMEGPIASRIHNLFNGAKLLLFTIPVPVWMLFVFGLGGAGRDWSRYWLLFLLFYLAVFGAMMVFPLHRYLLPCHYAVAMIAASGLARAAERVSAGAAALRGGRFQLAGLHLVLAGALVPQLPAAFPTDLAYVNFMRDTRVDDSMEVAATGSEGMWPGWGEQLLPVVEYLNSLSGADTLSVLFDYRFALHLKGRDFYGNPFDVSRDSLAVDYFVVSKAIWCRDRRLWEYVRDHKPVKVFSTRGVRYALLYAGPLPGRRTRLGFPIPGLDGPRPGIFR